MLPRTHPTKPRSLSSASPSSWPWMLPLSCALVLLLLVSLSGNTFLLTRLDATFCASRLGPIEATERTLPLGHNKVALHYRLKNVDVMKNASHAEDSVLVLVVNNNKESWGRNRTVDDYIALIRAFDYPSSKLSLGFLTSSIEEYDLLKSLFHRLLLTSFSQVTITFRDDLALHFESRNARKADAVQRARRSMLARYRNYALAQSLEPWHEHVVWIDSDIVAIPPPLVGKMVAAKKDILQPLCHLVGMTQDYDLNAWQGNRKVPTPAELELIHAGKLLWVPDIGPGGLHMNDMRAQEYHPLDSVGGTMLYVRADVHRQGVLFATHYLIGSEWQHEGYDGIETEGLCYVAGMLGYKCWSMPQDIIYHID
ncbi:Aste57867_2803 [Aphanomyces stellatus]|uniref:Aste57867_2803 protein n=1 Tax=Aphanomyces stellatus TaxID=120398 RepID=A0A485K8B6_9STRA|nr:hypothetical protein As57867_002796 [Aphanomyces stellatus]VFT79992.1 Aste57867_2803 [Aphanomyces stellatus]